MRFEDEERTENLAEDEERTEALAEDEERTETLVKEETGKLLSAVLYEASMEMKIGYSRSDA